MASIQLNFINQSNDQNNSQVVIFQANEADPRATPIAWKVIENCGPGWSHPFTYDRETTIAARDPYGNYTQQLPACTGQQLSLVDDPAGTVLKNTGSSAGADSIEFVNARSAGAADAHIFRGGRLLAATPGVVPAQEAVFAFKPVIRIRAVARAQEGAAIDPVTLSHTHTELPLSGIGSADIVMTGGGPGATSAPFAFTLQNIVPA
jgi:hypothetical protein